MFRVPEKDNPVCEECLVLKGLKHYEDCTSPCSHLISTVIHEQSAEVRRDFGHKHSIIP